MSNTTIFTVEGVVQDGQKRGTLLGYPTANIPCDSSISSGIYAGEVVWKEKTHSAALYKDEKTNVLEAHLLDFSENLYGEKVIVRGYNKIRDVATFSTTEDLLAAIKKDITEIRKICSPE